MDENGRGSSSDIITGLNDVAKFALATKRPSVISMSLGGAPNKPMDDTVCFLTVND